jgi:hypothetical protein
MARNTFFRLSKADPAFPKPIPITAKKRRCVTAEIDAYLLARRGQAPLPPLRPTVDAQRVQQKRTAKDSAGRSHVARR